MLFRSQVDGEQDLLETPPKSSAPVGNIIVNGGSAGLRQNGSIVKQEPAVANGDSILARHLSIVSVKPPPLVTSAPDTFACGMCSAKLKNKRNYDTHMKRHRGELPFKCDECPKTFQV